MERPKLYGTPLSHFTRKIRILLTELGVEFEFIRAAGVLGTSTAPYGDNPLLRVPTLVHGDDTVVESDHIARYIVGKFDTADRFGVRSEAAQDLNRLAVANGIMANEVVLILARRGGLTDLGQVAYFQKLGMAIDTALAWLDAHTDPDAEDFDYADMATICMWQHVTYYKIAEGLERYTRLGGRVARFSDRPAVARTSPEVSLAEAISAGWAPA